VKNVKKRDRDEVVAGN